MIIGVDSGAPQRARDQRQKIIAIAAHSTGWHSYRIDATGMNERLLTDAPPGWTARELVDELTARPARFVGFDFPFCVPHALLRDPKFAADVGHTDGPFLGWRSFNWRIAQHLPLDFTPFAPWRDRTERARLSTKRATDIAAGGQPPLKDKFQATFQMTPSETRCSRSCGSRASTPCCRSPAGAVRARSSRSIRARRCARWGS